MRRFRRIGRGAYSLTEAARLTGVPRYTILRWTQGYTYRYKSETRFSAPLIATAVPPVDGTPTIDFADLLEIRFLNAFRQHGVSARAVRIASERARELLGRPHPFSTQIFKTDGRTILADLVGDTGDGALLDLVKDQYQFKRIVDPYLYFGIEFNQLHEPSRWWPLGEDRNVVLDPDRSFGKPVVARGGVRTSILAAGYRAEDSLDLVATWYNVPIESVRDAVEFEQSLAA